MGISWDKLFESSPLLVNDVIRVLPELPPNDASFVIEGYVIVVSSDVSSFSTVIFYVYLIFVFVSVYLFCLIIPFLSFLCFYSGAGE
jgi:hypothetical protein